MHSLLYSILGFILAVGILITVHEWGHFWVARRMGVKVLRFSFGFGPSLFSWQDTQKTEYTICLIPLGGYVVMLDRPEDSESEAEKQQAFSVKSTWAKLSILAAGPAWNFIFAIIAYWLLFMIGLKSLIPFVGAVMPGTPAAQAGLREGLEIVAIQQQPTPNWESIALEIFKYHRQADFAVVTTLDTQSGQKQDHNLPLVAAHDLKDGKTLLDVLGLLPLDPIVPVIDKFLPEYPAEQSGLKVGDEIIAINQQKVKNRTEVTQYLQRQQTQTVTLTVLRQGETQIYSVTPILKTQDDGRQVGFIGVQFTSEVPAAKWWRTISWGPIDSLQHAIAKTSNYCLVTLKLIKQLVLGQLPFQYVAGPVSIADMAGKSIASGGTYFLGFLAMVSISLGIFNLLPIPILDGGRLLYCTIEGVLGRPIHPKVLEFSYKFGIVCIISLMGLALYNDLSRLS